MSEQLQLTIAYEEPDEDGWIVARVLQVPGALSQGRTREEARENVIDALKVVLAPDDDDPATANGSSELLNISFATFGRHLRDHGPHPHRGINHLAPAREMLEEGLIKLTLRCGWP
jgi:predicted RNase H-like HicB family nuclease